VLFRAGERRTDFQGARLERNGSTTCGCRRVASALVGAVDVLNLNFAYATDCFN